jgi:hypothetical protein
VPLLQPDPDILIDLASVFVTAYERGRFGRRIDYRVPCPISLRDEDKAWLNALVAPK